MPATRNDDNNFDCSRRARQVVRPIAGLVMFAMSIACGPATNRGATTAPTTSGVSTRAPVPQGGRFFLQLSGTPEVPADAQIVILDGDDTPAATVASLQARGATVLCYFNAGGFEDWRGDAADFDPSVIGEPLDGWPGERWLDIRATDDLLPLMTARIDRCAEKGFVGVDPDNVDGYDAVTGFDLKPTDSVAYVTALAAVAHERGLMIGLKNAVELIPELEPAVDFAVNEQCLAYGECEYYLPFLQAGKPVLHVEYERPFDEVCRSVPDGFSSMTGELDLEGSGRMC